MTQWLNGSLDHRVNGRDAGEQLKTVFEAMKYPKPPNPPVDLEFLLPAKIYHECMLDIRTNWFICNLIRFWRV